MKHPLRPPFGLAALTSVLALVTVGAVLTGVGCTTEASDGATGDGGVYVPTDASAGSCSTCVADRCTAAWALCLTNEDCLAVRACARGGASEECACKGASDTGSKGLALHRAFTTCNDARTCAGDGCANDCAASCASPTSTTLATCDVPEGSDVDASDDAGADSSDDAGADSGGDASDADAGAPPPGPSADRCASCAAGKCDGARKACAIGTECARFLECAFACADGTCVTGCGRSHATGQVAAAELAACAQAGCEEECGL